MIRILLLDTGNEWGGGTNSMFELLKRIDRTRFDVHALFYKNYPRGSSSDLRGEFEKLGLPLTILPPVRRPAWAKLANELLRGLLFWHKQWRRAAVHRVDDLWRTKPRARQIAAQLREGKFDLLYMNNQPSSNREGYAAARLNGVPAVQHCRIDVTLTPTEARMVNQLASRVICVSHGVAESLAGQGVRKDLIAVVCNGIDVRQSLPEAKRPAAVPHDAILVGTVGQLVARKAVHHLLEATANACSDGKRNIHVLILGDGPDRTMLKQRAHQLGISERVHFLGFEPAPLPWIAGMDILALCSEKEGLPRVLLEAMLLSRPVIASAVVGSQELVADGATGLLYPFGDVDVLTAHLARLTDDAALREQLGRAGHERVVAQYSIERYVAGASVVLSTVAESACST